MIGELVGSYRITQELGSGGMGVVYAAQHVVLGSKAAVKMLLPRHSSDKEVVSRFFNEARAATRIKHPGIVAVFDFGNHASGSAYLVMELLEGETLAQRLRRVGKMPWRETLVLARQTAGALEAAHRAGIVHRDLKPHNLFLVRDPDLPGGERVKVLDFGIAKLAAGPGTGDDTGHTREGAVLGTPKYMSPEQCRGAGQVDERADVYSLGCVLFAMTCGEPPFSGEGSGDVMAKQIYEPPPRPSTLVSTIDRGVESLILSCLQKDPSWRPQSMGMVGGAIDTLLGRDDQQASSDVGPHGFDLPAGAKLDATATSTPSPSDGASAPPASKITSTTLGASAAAMSGSQATRRSSGRGWWMLAAGVGIAALATVSSLRGKHGDSEATAPPVAPSADAAALARELPAPDAAVVKPPVPARSSRVTLKITSEPPGAAVVRISDGEWVGQSPVTLSMMPAEGEAEFAVRLRGYREKRVKLRTDINGEQNALLERDRGRPPGAAKAAPAPGKPVPGQAAPVTTPAAPAATAPAESDHVGDGTLDPFSEAQP